MFLSDGIMKLLLFLYTLVFFRSLIVNMYFYYPKILKYCLKSHQSQFPGFSQICTKPSKAKVIQSVAKAMGIDSTIPCKEYFLLHTMQPQWSLTPKWFLPHHNLAKLLKRKTLATENYVTHHISSFLPLAAKKPWTNLMVNYSNG